MRDCLLHGWKCLPVCMYVSCDYLFAKPLQNCMNLNYIEKTVICIRNDMNMMKIKYLRSHRKGLSLRSLKACSLASSAIQEPRHSPNQRGHDEEPYAVKVRGKSCGYQIIYVIQCKNIHKFSLVMTINSLFGYWVSTFFGRLVS